MKLVKRIVAIFMVLLFCFLCFSETVSAAETSAANARTNYMFQFFRNSRTDLSTENVSTDELITFGVFLSNFMIPGKTKYAEFYKSDSEINERVSEIFFGDKRNSGTIAKLTKMLFEGMESSDGLVTLQYKKDGSFYPLTITALVGMLAEYSEEMEKNGECYIYYGESPIYSVNSTVFNTAMAVSLAYSITETCGEEGLPDKDSTTFTGMASWLALQDNIKGNILIDGIGNIWYEANQGKTLFLPACLQPFVFDRSCWNKTGTDTISKKLPLVNAFYMGCMPKLTDLYTSDAYFGKVLAYNEALSSILKNNSNLSKNAVTMHVLEVNKKAGNLLKKYDDADTKYTSLSADALTNGAQKIDKNDDAYLSINAIWHNFFGISDDIIDFNDSVTYFNNMFYSAKDHFTGSLSDTRTNISYFTGHFAFTAMFPLKNCLDTMCYFNLGSGSSEYSTGNLGGNVSWDSDVVQAGDNSKDSTFTDSTIYKETLFTSPSSTSANNSEYIKYNTVTNSALKDMLISINDLLHNSYGGNGIKIGSKWGVDWSKCNTVLKEDIENGAFKIHNCALDGMFKKNSGTGQSDNIKLSELIKYGLYINISTEKYATSEELKAAGFVWYDYFHFNNVTPGTEKQTSIDVNNDGSVIYELYYDERFKEKEWNEMIGEVTKTSNWKDKFTQLMGSEDYVLMSQSTSVTSVNFSVTTMNSDTPLPEGVETYMETLNVYANYSVTVYGRNKTKSFAAFTESQLEGSGNNKCCAFHSILYNIYSHFKQNLKNISWSDFKSKINNRGIFGYALASWAVTGTYIYGNSVVKDLNRDTYYYISKIFCTDTSVDDWGNLREAFVVADDAIKNGGILPKEDNGFQELRKAMLGNAEIKLGNKGNMLKYLFDGLDADSKYKAFETIPISNVATTSFKTDEDHNRVVTPLQSSILGSKAFVWEKSVFIFGRVSAIGESENVTEYGHWKVDWKGDNFFTGEGATKLGTYTPPTDGTNGDKNKCFVSGMSIILDSLYTYRIASIRSVLAEALTTTCGQEGQFVANKCNVWPGIYWSYMTMMLNIRVNSEGKLENDTYANPLLPQMILATSGTGLDLSEAITTELGEDALEDMSLEEKQEDLLNKALQILSTDTSEYRNNWFKSMIDSWIISAHKSVIGTYTNTDLSFNMGVETGSTTYASVTGYVNTPKLTDIEITSVIIKNYGVVYIIMLLIVLVYLFALVITGAKGVKEGIAIAIILSFVLVFPQVLLNNTIGIMNSVVDSMYSDRFNFWAIAKHQASLNTLADATATSTADYIVASNIEMAKQVYSTDQGVRIKWPSPKKIDAFNSIFSSAISNENSTVNLTIFKTLFNSYFNQEQYVYDEFETYSYRPYNAIASEAKSYFEAYMQAKEGLNGSGNISTAFKAIKDTLYVRTGGDINKVSYYEDIAIDNTAYSDNVSDNSYAKVNSNVALAAMLDSNINSLFNFIRTKDDSTNNEYGVGIKKDWDNTSSRALYLAYSESEYYYFYNVLKSQWYDIENAAKPVRLKDAMLESNTFEKNIGSKKYIRDFLGMEYLFEYVIPYINEGNEYVKDYINIEGINISNYDFNADQADSVNIKVDENGNAITDNSEYVIAKNKKEEYGQVWMLYSSWVDQLYAANKSEKVSGKYFNTIEAGNYNMYLGRDMVFSELDLMGEYDELTQRYIGKIDYSSLSNVEQKIITVLKNTYEDIMYLNNYWNYDEEVILTAAAMMATFNFNKEFSNYSILGDSNVLYPQNFELQNFNYDAFLRLIIMNSTGESLTDTTDLYTRVIGKTSIFTGILLLLVDITAVIAIPAMKLLILLLLLVLGLAMCLTCMAVEIKEIPKKLWTCLIKPIILFAMFTIAFAWVVSLFVGTGLSSYVGASSTSIVTNDPTITFLLMFLVNVLYIIGLGYIFLMLFRIAKREIKGVALAVTGAVAGAATMVGSQIHSAFNTITGQGATNVGGSGTGSGSKSSKNKNDSSETQDNNDINGETDEVNIEGKKKGSMLMDDLNSDTEIESEKQEKSKPKSPQDILNEMNEVLDNGNKDKSSIVKDMNTSDKIDIDKDKIDIDKSEDKTETTVMDENKSDNDNVAPIKLDETKPSKTSKKEKVEVSDEDTTSKSKKSVGEVVGGAILGTQATVSNAYHKGKLGLAKAASNVKVGAAKVKRVAQTVVDRDTYKSLGYGIAATGLKAKMAVEDGIKATGEGIVSGAKAVGNAAKTGVKAVEKGITTGVQAVGDTAKTIGVETATVYHEAKEKGKQIVDTASSKLVEAQMMAASIAAMSSKYEKQRQEKYAQEKKELQENTVNELEEIRVTKLNVGLESNQAAFADLLAQNEQRKAAHQKQEETKASKEIEEAEKRAEEISEQTKKVIEDAKYTFESFSVGTDEDN